MALIESVLERKTQDGKTFWIAIIDGKEVMAWDAKILDLKGKECPYPIIKTKSGKDMIAFPKEGGGKKGGYGGKSDKEIYLQALTMSMAYAKDILVAEINTVGKETPDASHNLITLYKSISQAILADLKAIEGSFPAQGNVPKQESKAPEKTPEKPKYVPPEGANLTVKQKLEKKAWAYLQNLHSDSDDNFRTLLMELTAFTGKDGKEVSCDSLEKLSDKWAGSAIGKLEKLIEEEERKAIASMDIPDINI